MGQGRRATRVSNSWNKELRWQQKNKVRSSEMSDERRGTVIKEGWKLWKIKDLHQYYRNVRRGDQEDELRLAGKYQIFCLLKGNTTQVKYCESKSHVEKKGLCFPFL